MGRCLPFTRMASEGIVVKLLKSLGIVTALVATSLIIGTAAPSCAVAQSPGAACSDSCKAAYGACYKSTANRAACEGQLQRCLQGCLATKR